MSNLFAKKNQYIHFVKHYTKNIHDNDKQAKNNKHSSFMGGECKCWLKKVLICKKRIGKA